MYAQTIKITANGVITLPSKLRKILRLERGDMVNMELKDNCLIVKPAKIIDAEDAWFYSKEWQKKEKGADDALKTGRYKKFDNVDDLIADLYK